MVVRTPSFFEELATIIEAVDLDVWKAYLQFRYIDAAAPMLSKDFVDAHFALYNKELSGIVEQQPRWKRGVDMVSGRLGEVVGKLYVQKHFKPEAKAEMEKLVKNLLAAFDGSIDNLTWMTDATKARQKRNYQRSLPRSDTPTAGKTTQSLRSKRMICLAT